jgi:hypothetical protein
MDCPLPGLSSAATAAVAAIPTPQTNARAAIIDLFIEALSLQDTALG